MIRVYLSEKKGTILAAILFPLFFSIYFLYLCGSQVYSADVLYLDGVYAAGVVILFLVDFRRFRRKSRQKEDMEQEIECRKEEIAVLKEEITEQNDYITRWLHEVKVPLSALELMNGRNSDAELKREMRFCTERIGMLLRTMLMYGKMGSMENDVTFTAVKLEDAVRETVKNQSFFLIRGGFEIRMEMAGIKMFTDRRWLVYMLDQITANAVKYKAEESDRVPEILFRGRRISDDETELMVRDNGRGIAAEEMPYLFDRGYTGGNVRNGDYRSTGMGLYFTRKAADRLGVKLEVHSEEGKWTSFVFRFYNNYSIRHE